MIWHLAVNMSTVDGKTLCVEVVKDKYGKYFAQGNALLLDLALSLPQVNDLMAIFGYDVDTFTPPSINGYDFRFNAIHTNGHITVFASNDTISPTVATNDQSAMVAALTGDSDFVETFYNRDIVLINTLYVDYQSDNPYAEAFNVVKTLQAAGRTVVTFTDISASSLKGLLARARSLFIPELEKNSDDETFINDLSADAKNVIRDYVRNGGSFIQFYVGRTNELAVVNTLFGYNIQGSTYYSPTYSKTPGTKGTVLESGPDEVDDLNASRPVITSSLPSGSLAAYTHDSVTALFISPYGAGKVVGLMVDWYDSAPWGEQDGNWVQVIGLVTR